ncbi:MAG: CRISPR-associated protein Cas5 [Deltaproteobacteria bacterium]|nr:CRISPR-associated protein Cas5 [Deltaproteobacteria bacterium]
MATFWLRVSAPFAAFRWMQAGVWRATSPVIPPSAAWGLVLNLASIDSRLTSEGATTLVRPDAPAFEIAVAALAEPERGSLYQQLHSYPVGNSSQALAEGTHGAKYHVVPVRRELLTGFDAAIGVRTHDGALLERVRRGLKGELGEPRYGLPFAGDNSFLFDRIELLEQAPEARWYSRTTKARRGTCRLTIGIDRADASRTTTGVFAPVETKTSDVPAEAWTWVPKEG